MENPEGSGVILFQESSNAGGSSRCSRNFLVVAIGVGVLTIAVVLGLAVGVPLSRGTSYDDPNVAHALQILDDVPLIDGHNDLPWRYLMNAANDVEGVNLNENMTGIWPIIHTDIPKLRAGKVGAQFWALYTSCNRQYVDAVRQCLEQADVIKRIIRKYPDTFQIAATAQDIRDVFKSGKIASLIGMEGGHCIDSSFSALRMFYDLGVRYMTITHTCNTPWADNSNEDPGPGEHQGLSKYGEDVIREMNRLGMMVDLSHVSKNTMLDSLEVSQAPVIFSHSSVFSICNHTRNVPDEVLDKLKEKQGLLMINFYSDYVSCQETSTLSQLADHIEYAATKCGHDCVGIGADYDGVDRVPVGLEDVSKYPFLFAELVKRGWTDDNLKKLAGSNLLRVMEKAEEVAADLRTKGTLPKSKLFIGEDRSNKTCFTPYQMSP